MKLKLTQPKFSLEQNYLNQLYEDDLLALVAKYKFTIAIENAICDDYITEKLWRPLIAGSVPIYLGSPSIEVQSCNSSINVHKFLFFRTGCQKTLPY